MNPLNDQEIHALQALMSSGQWQGIKVKMLTACPSLRNAQGDNGLIRSAIGFEAWRQCLDTIETFAVPPEKKKRPKRDRDEGLEYEDPSAAPN